MLLAGEGAGGAQQVVGDGRADGPGAVGGEAAGGLVGQWAVDQVGEHGLDDRVPAVGDVGLGDRFGVVGEERVIPPDREQFLGFGAVAPPGARSVSR